ncbi:hypothetical protein V9T40_000211 [Parthenolecanium corni]|uniref:Uncharacterized protein n=1 Tax=Parthenolecanium corni TaxID=536013 RepID=A0AAN9Y092_9HEMI
MYNIRASDPYTRITGTYGYGTGEGDRSRSHIYKIPAHTSEGVQEEEEEEESAASANFTTYEYMRYVDTSTWGRIRNKGRIRAKIYTNLVGHLWLKCD